MCELDLQYMADAEIINATLEQRGEEESEGENEEEGRNSDHVTHSSPL